MKLTYCDSGLYCDLGHHAASARTLAGHLVRLGHEVEIHGRTGCDHTLSAALGIRPTFRRWCYERFHLDDAVAGWLKDFNDATAVTIEDLQAACPDGSLIYWNSAQPAQLLAVLHYLSRHQHSRAVLEFGTGAGLATKIVDGSIHASFPDPRENADATLYRFCAYAIGEDIRPRITLATFDRKASTLYENVLECPVQTFPVPRDAGEGVRSRVGKPSITISFLGHQRGEKGYHLVPSIVRRVLDYARWQTRGVRFLIHNGAGKVDVEAQAPMRKLAVEYPDVVTIDERLADGPIWQELLDASDLIVLPYYPDNFHARYSAIACEAVANGVPCVVPDGTTLADTVLGLGGGVAFSQWEAPVIAASVIACIETFDVNAECAWQGVEKWKAGNGGGRTAAAIVESLS